MHCGSCKTNDAMIVRTKWDEKYGRYEMCDQCSNVRLRDAAIKDVYIGSGGGLRTDMNLCDPKTGVPIPFSTKGEKAAIMQKLNLKQADSSERHHGAREMNKNAKFQSE